MVEVEVGIEVAAAEVIEEAVVGVVEFKEVGIKVEARGIKIKNRNGVGEVVNVKSQNVWIPLWSKFNTTVENDSVF